MSNVEQVGFDAGMSGSIQFLTIEEGKQKKVGFIENVPGLVAPITKVKRHFITEKEGGKYIQCTGGLCCEIYTWNKFEKAYTKSKAKTDYMVPCIIYDNDKVTLEPTCYVGILTLNFFQYQKFCEQVNSCEPGTLPFFSRDCTVSYGKNGAYNDYSFIKGETRAIWQTNEKMKAIVEEQLSTFAERLKTVLPPVYSETELAELIEKWNKVKKEQQMAETTAVNNALDSANNLQNLSAEIQESVNTAVNSTVETSTTTTEETIANILDKPQENFSLDALAGVLGQSNI